MKTVWRTIAGSVAGFVLAFGLVVAVELFGAAVHPFPEGFGHTKEEMCEHVARFPHWALAAVVPMWGFTAFAATWLAGRLGNGASALVLGVLLLAAVNFNISMLPYYLWFKILMPAVILLAVIGGYFAAAPRKLNRAPTESVSG